MIRRRFLFLLLPFALGGCGMFDWATANMPVIGQRCENWQCFTASGQQQSEINEQQRLHPEMAATPGGSGRAVPSENPQAAPTPAGDVAAAPAQPAAAPAVPLAPPAGAEGAYVYVPRSKPEPGASPFDGQMPAPIPAQ